MSLVASSRKSPVLAAAALTMSDPCSPDDPVQAATEAGLRYETDAEPGIRREQRRGRTRYIAPAGGVVRDVRTLARIDQLAIPPAWTDVWISTRANGHLQATGRDARGRKQYRYHPHWRVVRDETKYGRLLAFGRALPAIRQRVDADLGRRGLPMDKVLAAVVLLLERTLIRIGNEEYARTNGSYGLTTLRDDHVEVTATEVRFSFRGKSGKAHDVEFRDRRLARIVRGCRDLPGQTLFQYRGADGVPHALGSSEVNAYVREVTGEAFTAKDFRTWHGSVLAAVTLLELETSEHTGASVVPEAIRRVASQLGNTPAVCRNCYVHPAVLDAHAEGRLRPLADQTALDEGGGYAHGERLLLALLAS